MLKIHHVKDFTNGWFIGDFLPSIHRTRSFEVAYHTYPKNHKYEPHIHAEAREINLVVKGSIYIPYLQKTLVEGDIFVVEMQEYYEVKFLEETSLIIIKSPSIPGDKFSVDSSNTGANNKMDYDICNRIRKNKLC